MTSVFQRSVNAIIEHALKRLTQGVIQERIKNDTPLIVVDVMSVRPDVVPDVAVPEVVVPGADADAGAADFGTGAAGSGADTETETGVAGFGTDTGAGGAPALNTADTVDFGATVAVVPGSDVDVPGSGADEDTVPETDAGDVGASGVDASGVDVSFGVVPFLSRERDTYEQLVKAFKCLMDSCYPQLEEFTCVSRYFDTQESVRMITIMRELWNNDKIPRYYRRQMYTNFMSVDTLLSNIAYTNSLIDATDIFSKTFNNDPEHNPALKRLIKERINDKSARPSTSSKHEAYKLASAAALFNKRIADNMSKLAILPNEEVLKAEMAEEKAKADRASLLAAKQNEESRAILEAELRDIERRYDETTREIITKYTGNMKDMGDTGDTEDMKDTGDTGDTEDMKDMKDMKDTGDTEDMKDMKDMKDTGDTGDTEDMKDELSTQALQQSERLKAIISSGKDNGDIPALLEAAKKLLEKINADDYETLSDAITKTETYLVGTDELNRQLLAATELPLSSEDMTMEACIAIDVWITATKRVIRSIKSRSFAVLKKLRDQIDVRIEQIMVFVRGIYNINVDALSAAKTLKDVEDCKERIQDSNTKMAALTSVSNFIEGYINSMKEQVDAKIAEVKHAVVDQIDVAKIWSEVEGAAVDPTAVDPVAMDPTAVDPTAMDPTAVVPTAVVPTAVVPTAVVPTAVVPTAVDPIVVVRTEMTKRTPPRKHDLIRESSPKSSNDVIHMITNDPSPKNIDTAKRHLAQLKLKLKLKSKPDDDKELQGLITELQELLNMIVKRIKEAQIMEMREKVREVEIKRVIAMKEKEERDEAKRVLEKKQKAERAREKDAKRTAELLEARRLAEEMALLTNATRAKIEAAADEAARTKAAAKEAARKRAAEDKASENEAARKRAAEKKAAENEAARKRAAEDRAAEDKAAEDKAAEVMAAEVTTAKNTAARKFTTISDAGATSVGAIPAGAIVVTTPAVATATVSKLEQDLNAASPIDVTKLLQNIVKSSSLDDVKSGIAFIDKKLMGALLPFRRVEFTKLRAQLQQISDKLEGTLGGGVTNQMVDDMISRNAAIQVMSRSLNIEKTAYCMKRESSEDWCEDSSESRGIYLNKEQTGIIALTRAMRATNVCLDSLIARLREETSSP